MRAQTFFWYELMTTDVDAAEAFYSDVVGWTAQDFPRSPGMPRYVVMNAADGGVGGLMTLPEDARKMGMPPAWVGYVYASDVDAATDSLKRAGGKVHRAPDDIPGVGRFSVVADPQGAMFMFLQPNGADQPDVPLGALGHVGWHELFAGDWKAAFDFYSGQFGWTKDSEFDMGPMGIYMLFAAGKEAIGGMMDKPEQIPMPVWQFYFNVDGIEAAAGRVKSGGGNILMGPHQVPGGQWVLQCTDPQGAHFALVSNGR